MDLALIKGGVVINVIAADSAARAQAILPGYDHYIGRPAGVSIGWVYDEATGTLTPPEPTAPTEPRYIRRLSFLLRFTDAEAVAIDLASQGMSVRAATLRRNFARLNHAELVDLDYSKTRAGVQMLEAAGLIAAGRAAEILDGPISEIERFKGAGA